MTEEINDTSQLQARYSIGDAMTYEQMTQTRDMEKQVILEDPHTNTKEENAYLFEDEPVASKRIALINAVAPGMPQQHDNGKMFIKVKCVTASQSQAMRMVSSIHERKDEQRYGVYMVEMFKFLCLPPPTDEEMDTDTLMNDALSSCYTGKKSNRDAFLQRKEQMLQEVDRHNALHRQIASGKLPPSASESRSICPEQENSIVRDMPNEELMETDVVLSQERYVVIASVDITEGPLNDHVIYKICGAFMTETEAEEHMINLKMQQRYKIFDVVVADMYSWLEMPPPYELINTVKYDSSKLTEVLGKRKQKINIESSSLQEPCENT